MHSEDALLNPAVERPDPLEAVLFDVDGVVTPTAKAHAAAWKQLFDTFLVDWAARTGTAQAAFDPSRDYHRYLDGKPRLDGMRSFLAARGITLPEGTAADMPDALTVQALAKRKNAYFVEWLSRNPVTPYPGTIALIGALRSAGIRTAAFSASRNAARVLESAGVSRLFDLRLDGNDLARLGLPGKPDPALLQAVTDALGTTPDRTAVIEDAIAGIQAGRRGGFASVIGVDRNGSPELLATGADIVVGDLAELLLQPERRLVAKTLDTLPSLRDQAELLHDRLCGRRLAVFLDYDGTLTPIVEQHDRAFLAPDMRAAVARLAQKCTVVIMSGRDLARIRELVNLDSVWFAGSHGFQIAGPGATEAEHEIGTDFIASLDLAQTALEKALVGIGGHAIERKKFSIAVHYRRVREAAVADVREIVDRVLAAHPDLRLSHGKKVFELRPGIDWNKGQAVLWLLARLGMDDSTVLPIFVGDDITDEDAFRTLAGRGLGIVVRYDGTRRTAADYAVADTDEVGWLLDLLAELASTTGTSGARDPA